MIKHFKDREPLETILIAKNFILKNHILVIEKWSDNINGLYSLSLQIEETGLSVNGKGATKKLALASAYGELMERLQNLAFFRMNNNILDQDINTMLKTVELEEFKFLTKHLLEKIPNINLPIVVDEFIEYSKTKNLTISNKVCTYKSIDSNELLTVPYIVLDYCYGTNGMVAGNSRDEAYVEGLSEVLERYVAKQLITKDITPPELSGDIINNLYNFNKVKDYIYQIEKSQKYKIEIRDASLGKNIPAIAVILYNLDTSSYYIKIGVHPVLEIAIERCFTELLQGQKLNDFSAMVKVNSNKEKLGRKINLHNYFVNGSGAFPLSFFNDKSSYIGLQSKTIMNSNAEMREYLVELIREFGFKIYVNDATCSEIFAYHIIVPGMSEAMCIDYESIHNLTVDWKITNIMKLGLGNLTKDSGQELLDYINICGFDFAYPMSKLILGLKLNNSSIYNKIPIYLLKFWLCVFLEQKEDALNSIVQYNTYLNSMDIHNSFFRCCEDYFSLCTDDFNNEAANIEIHKFLSKFYDSSILSRLRSLLNDCIFNEFTPVNCSFDCESCSISDSCLTKQQKELFTVISKTKEGFYDSLLY